MGQLVIKAALINPCRKEVNTVPKLDPNQTVV
jgi:hypothetical protein